MVRECLILICKMTIGTAVLDFVGAEPIGFHLSCAVLEISAIKCGRREEIDVSCCNFALIGRMRNWNSGF